MRWRAQEIATEELGPRHEFDIRRARAKEITQERFTSLDWELERLAKDGRLELRSPKRPTRVDPLILLSRLEHLEAMGFAERLSPNAWSLSEDWQTRLRELGARGDIIKQIHDAVRGDSSRYRIVRAGEPILTGLHARAEPEPLVGRVASKGLSDEMKGVSMPYSKPDGFAQPPAQLARRDEARGDPRSFEHRRPRVDEGGRDRRAQLNRFRGGKPPAHLAREHPDELKRLRRVPERAD